MQDFERDPIRESITIAAPLERCWELSTRVELVQKTLGMKLVGGVTSGLIAEGSHVHWRGWKFGWPTEHHTLITAFQAPHAGRLGDRAAEFGGQRVAWFEDSQEHGRFATFHHLHLFREQANGVLLEDRIHFSLPFGFPGKLVAQWLMAPHIRKLARQRFGIIKQLAEGEGWRAWAQERGPERARNEPRTRHSVPQRAKHLTTRGEVMKAAVLHEYGGPSKLKYEDVPDPKPGPGEVLVRVLAASINPVDWKMRSGEAKERFPVEFPGILGRDAAGLVQAVGEGVNGFAEGDRVFALAWKTYAELCVVKASDLAKIPEGLEIPTAATIPLVSLTGDQLIRRAVNAQAGQTIVLTGAVGSVGRCALFCALEFGVKVIAGVRKSQLEEARNLGAVEAINIGDKDDIARIGQVDAVADTVGGAIGTALLAKVKPGGTFGSLLGPPKDASLHPLVHVQPMTAQPDAAAIVHYAEAVRDGRLTIPISRMMPLAEAGEAQAAAEKGGGKIVLLA